MAALMDGPGEQRKGIAMTGELIKERGRRFLALFELPAGSLKFSNGWLSKFQERHRLSRSYFLRESDYSNIGALEEATSSPEQKNIARLIEISDEATGANVKIEKTSTAETNDQLKSNP
ncbi:hypothetical protein K3495_g1385 [Podosphaera aphanis]|nr:hypothetical protein K3495_g1385 [Podosphaera aphanis]